MKKTLLFKMFTISFLLLSNIGWVNGQALLVENFDYATGSLLTSNGWANHSGTNGFITVTTGLSFADYMGSDIGGAALLDSTGEDVNRTFAAQTSGTIYAAFVIQTEATNSAGYFISFGQTTIGTTFFTRVWVNATGNGVGIGASAPAAYLPITAGTPTLLVMKLDNISKVSSLYVFNTFPTSEPITADATFTETTSYTNVGSIALRQYNAAQRIIVDGIRVATNWGDAVTAFAADVTPPSFTSTPTNGDMNVAINAPIVLTFDEAIRNIDDSEITDANVASLLTLKETDASGADVPFTATIDAAKKIITATPTSAFANSKVYYAAINPVEDASNNAAAFSSMTFTTVASTTPVLSDVAITETAPYLAGDLVTITWTSANVTNVLIEAWIPSETKWDVLFASTASDGTETFTIPANAQYSAEYKLRISDIANPLITAESAVFTVIAVVTDLASLRAQPANAIVKYTGIATVTYARTTRNQKYIQDATAAVLIDDPTAAPGFITGTYNVGDGITNIVGKIILYNGLIEFTPTATTGEPATGIEIVPEVRTLESLTAADQCKLVKIENFAFADPIQYDPSGIFVKSKNYDIVGQDNTLMAYRTAFAESDYIGGMVPVGVMSSVCLVGQFNTQMQITARSWSDMTLPFVLPSLVITEIMYNSPESTDEEWFEIYNNGTTAVDMEGFYMVDSDTAHMHKPWIFPAGSSIAPGEYFTAQLSSGGAFPFTPDAVLTTTGDPFNLGNTSDQVKIYHSNGQLIDSVQYADKDPWPIAADGNGSSLTLCDPSKDNTVVSNWEASLDEFTTLQATTIKATPGSGCVLHTAVAPKLQSGITVYPNPTSDNLYISNSANDQLEITVLSSLGKSVKSLQANQGVTSVDLSDLPKGIYLVKMLNKTSKKIQIQKVVVR